jgi:hypothetical protein
MNWKLEIGIFSLIAGILMIFFWKLLMRWQIYYFGKGDKINTNVTSILKLRLLFTIAFLILMGLLLIFDII